jgi:hypothetical protein
VTPVTVVTALIPLGFSCHRSGGVSLALQLRLCEPPA